MLTLDSGWFGGSCNDTGHIN